MGLMMKRALTLALTATGERISLSLANAVIFLPAEPTGRSAWEVRNISEFQGLRSSGMEETKCWIGLFDLGGGLVQMVLPRVLPESD